MVKSRDDALNVTVCSGRFVLELPPGAENAFDGERRLSADVEYAAQAALDGSGLVYQMDGAEPIIYRLATVGLTGQPMPKIVAAPQPSAPPGAPPQVAIVEPAAPIRPVAAGRAAAARARKRRRAEAAAGAGDGAAELQLPLRPDQHREDDLRLAAPRRARPRDGLALVRADGPGRPGHAQPSEAQPRCLPRTRRERCGSESCVDAAYASRMAELRSIATANDRRAMPARHRPGRAVPTSQALETFPGGPAREDRLLDSRAGLAQAS